MIKKADFPALLTGMMATLASIGIARFAYTPLLPELVLQGWFNDTQAAYLGASNLLGYLIGALFAHSLSERFSIKLIIRLCFIFIALSLFLCAKPASFEWFFIWRLVAGIAGAILTVIGPALALSVTSTTQHTSVGTFIFAGIGLGALLSALIIPPLMQINLSVTWLVLGGLTILVGFVCNYGLLNLPKEPIHKSNKPITSIKISHVNMIVVVVMIAYALDAVGYVPHTVFWVDYLAREQQLGIKAASTQWAIFGLGATCGPFIARIVVHKLGWHFSLTTAFMAKAIAVGLPLLSITLTSQIVSSFIVGAMIPGVVSLTSGRIAELVGPIEYKRYWGLATALFAVGQAVSGYGMSALYESWKSYYFLFYIGSTMLAIGALLIVISRYAKP